MITTTMPAPWVLAFNVGFTLYAGHWAFRAFVPRRRKRAPPELLDRSEGSLHARRRRLLFVVSPIAALALLIVSRVAGPGAFPKLNEWVFGWIMVFESTPVRIALFGLTMLLLIVALVGAVRDTASWLHESEMA